MINPKLRDFGPSNPELGTFQGDGAPRVMPLFAPLYEVGTELARLQWLTLQYRTDASVLASMLPGPLQPDDEPEVVIWIARFLSATFERDGQTLKELDPYTQAGVDLRCRFAGASGAFPLVSYITGLNHGITGRELFGLPKKQASRVTLNHTSARVEAEVVTADGTQVVGARGFFRGVEAGDHTAGSDGPTACNPHLDLVPAWMTRQLTAKVIPSATGTGYDVAQLVHVPFEFSAERDVVSLDAQLELGGSANDPIDALGVRGPISARWGFTDLRVLFGTYLAPLDLGQAKGGRISRTVDGMDSDVASLPADGSSS